MRGITLLVRAGGVRLQAAPRKPASLAWCLEVPARYVLQRNSVPWKYCPALAAGDLRVTLFSTLLKVVPDFCQVLQGLSVLTCFDLKIELGIFLST